MDFIKVDIEGSELSFLKGAVNVLKQEEPPVMVIEMALNTSKPFNYVPDDLMRFISGRAEYEFYALDEENHRLERIDGFKEYELGANVLCFPKNADRSRLDGLDVTG